MLQIPEESRSLWRQSYKESIYPKASGEIKVDIAIIGGGITGLTAAYLLKSAGQTVAVLEKDTVGGGTTGRTTGKVTSQHNLIYCNLIRRHGENSARKYALANQMALNKIGSIINKENIVCDWHIQNNYVYTADPDKIDVFKHEAKAAANLGLPASFETEIPLPIPIKAAVRFSGQAKMNAQKYVVGLAGKVDGDGSYVFEKCRAVGIRDGSPCRVSTLGGKIRAKAVIVATNVPTLPLMARGGYCILEYPTESYIVATKIKNEVKGMYISPDEDNYSILPVQFAGSRYLLIGGESHISGWRGNVEEKYEKLADYAQLHFGATSVDYKWSDRDYIAYDGMPLVGKVYPWSKNLYCATAFRKWGLTNGTAAAIILHDLIIGKKNRWADIFQTNRTRPIKEIPTVFKQYARGDKD